MTFDDRFGKGFAGLESLVSDVDETIASVPEAKPRPDQAEEGKLDAEEAKETASAPNQSDSSAPSGLSKGGMWFVGTVVGLIVISLILSSGKKKELPTSAWEPPAEAVSTPPPAPAPATALAAAPSNPFEDPIAAKPATPAVASTVTSTTEMPPVGSGLILNSAQIRYCLVEDVKLGSLKSIVNRYSSDEIDDYNALVSDHNSRCGHFRYRSGTLQGIRSEVEAQRSYIESEAKRQWVKKHAGLQDSLVNEPSQPNPVPAEPAFNQ